MRLVPDLILFTVNSPAPIELPEQRRLLCRFQFADHCGQGAVRGLEWCAAWPGHPPAIPVDLFDHRNPDGVTIMMAANAVAVIMATAIAVMITAIAIECAAKAGAFRRGGGNNELAGYVLELG
jgi:hypothetical protein